VIECGSELHHYFLMTNLSKLDTASRVSVHLKWIHYRKRSLILYSFYRVTSFSLLDIDDLIEGVKLIGIEVEELIK